MIVIATTGRAAAPPCDPDNGGLTLPQGFCAAVVADNVGAARHLVVAAERRSVRRRPGTAAAQTGGVVALRDTNGDGKLDTREKFGDNGSTGIALRNGYLYYATTTSVVRYKMTAGRADADRRGGDDRRRACPISVSTPTRGSRSTAEAALYVNVGAPSNACQQPDRAGRRSPARIRVRCSRSTAASGGSTRTSRDRSRRTASGSPPGCAR